MDDRRPRMLRQHLPTRASSMPPCSMICWWDGGSIAVPLDAWRRASQPRVQCTRGHGVGIDTTSWGIREEARQATKHGKRSLSRCTVLYGG